MAVWVAERMAFVIIIIYQRCLYMFIANITIVALHYGKLWMKLHTNIQIMTNRTKCGYLLFYKNRRTAGMIARLFPAVLDFELDRQPDMIFCNKCREIVGHTRQFFRLPETKTRRIGVGGSVPSRRPPCTYANGDVDVHYEIAIRKYRQRSAAANWTNSHEIGINGFYQKKLFQPELTPKHLRVLVRRNNGLVCTQWITRTNHLNTYHKVTRCETKKNWISSTATHGLVVITRLTDMTNVTIKLLDVEITSL